jgi:hypothetical protein
MVEFYFENAMNHWKNTHITHQFSLRARTSMIVAVFCPLFLVQGGLNLFAQKATYYASSAKKTAAPSSVQSSASSKMQAAPNRTELRAEAGNIWLSLDVVEHQYNASGSELGKEKYRSDVDLQIIDSASNRQMMVRSGETIQLQPRRTYFIMLSDVPQRYGMVTTIAGQQTQILRTPKLGADGDVMFERKFMLNSRPGATSAREMGAPLGMKLRKLPPPEIGDMEDIQSPPSRYAASKPPSGFSGKMSGLNYYVIQYCSLKSQADALDAKSYLMRNGVRDARVEIYVDKFGAPFYRLRSGSYTDLSLAKMTVEQTLWKNRKFLGLKQKPIIVKAGV